MYICASRATHESDMRCFYKIILIKHYEIFILDINKPITTNLLKIFKTSH